MCTRCLFVFLAGALAMHTIGHIIMAFTNMLPLHVLGITLTSSLNYLVIGGSAVLTVLCLYLASGYKCECSIKK